MLMIKSSAAAMVRQLRSFMEMSGLPWSKVRIFENYGDDRREDNAEIAFLHGERTIQIAIWAPGSILNGESLPLGRLIARSEGKVVKGAIDQTTWDNIVRFIRGEEGL